VVNLLQTWSSAVAKRPRDASCLSVVSFNSTKRQAQLLIFCYTLALDLPLRKLNYVLFSSLRRIHLYVAFCAVNRLAPWQSVIHHWTDHRQLIALAPARHRSIAGYRPTIVLIAAGRSSVHNMRWNQILSQNPDFSLPHVHSTPPLGWQVPSEYCYNVWYVKIRMVWLPEREKKFEDIFIRFDKCSNMTDTRADRRTDTVWRLRPRLHSIAQQKMVIKQQKLMLKTSMEV